MAKIMQIERTAIIRNPIRIRLLKRWAIYFDLPIRIIPLASKLGGINRSKVTKWTPEMKKAMSDYMKKNHGNRRR